MSRRTTRRRFLRRTGAGLAGVTALAGCLDDGDGSNATTEGTTDGTTQQATGQTTDQTTSGTTGTTGGPGGTLNVATYDSFTGEGAAGNWLKSAFEAEYPDATVEFTTPENGVNDLIQRKSEGASIDTDLYVGLNTGELVRADEKLDVPLFQSVGDQLSRAGDVKPELQTDPQGRAIPYDTGYITLVYDENVVSNPGTFDALLEPAYEDQLLAQNAQQSDPGRAFLLWTIKAKGEDGYLDYWADLVDNGATILSDWWPSYNAYLDGEAGMVVSYSTDQVYYHGDDVDMSRHQVGFLNDQGYANPEAMAVLDDAPNADLARLFVDFVLSPEAQAEIAVRNVQFPAVEGVDPGDKFGQYALEPPESVTFTYDELAGNLSTWIDDWSRQIARK